MMRSIIHLYLLLFSVCSFGQAPSITKVYNIEQNGISASVVSKIKVGDKHLPFNLLISKTTKEGADNMVLDGNYKYHPGKKVDTLRFYSNNFSVGDFFYFSENNITVSEDSSRFSWNNVYRVNGEKKGLKFKKNFDKINYLFVFPSNFKITNLTTNPKNVELYIEGMVASISAQDTKAFEYQIEYQKFPQKGFLKGERIEKIIKTFHLEKKNYWLDLWDPRKSDGDKINIYINGTLFFPDLEITNEIFSLPIPLIKAKKDHSFIVIESESEGSEGPNTIQGRFRGDGYDEEFKIFTDKKTNAVIEIFIK